MILESKNLIVNKKNGLIDKDLFFHIENIKNYILKKDYDLSINFISPKIAQELNIKYRNKEYFPNILSFPLSKKNGEIFICLYIVRKEAKKFSLTYKQFLTLLIVHGCLHLKGMHHSEKMSKLEEKISQKFVLK